MEDALNNIKKDLEIFLDDENVQKEYHESIQEYGIRDIEIVDVVVHEKWIECQKFNFKLIFLKTYKFQCNNNIIKVCELKEWSTMNENEIEEFVENFKGMLWDDLDDELAAMSREDLIAVVIKLKKRYG